MMMMMITTILQVCFEATKKNNTQRDINKICGKTMIQIDFWKKLASLPPETMMAKGDDTAPFIPFCLEVLQGKLKDYKPAYFQRLVLGTGNWTCWYMISSNDFGLLTEHHGTSLSTVVIAWNEKLWILSCCVGKLHTSPKSLPTPKKGSLTMVCHHLFISFIFVVGRLKVARPPMIWRGGLGVFRSEDAFPAFWNIICCELVDGVC